MARNYNKDSWYSAAVLTSHIARLIFAVLYLRLKVSEQDLGRIYKIEKEDIKDSKTLLRKARVARFAKGIIYITKRGRALGDRIRKMA